MVGVVEHEHVAPAGVGAREPQREVVRLAARVDEEDDAQRVRERGGEPPRVADEQVVQVPRVGVQPRHLRRGGGDHARMRVPDVADVVDEVEVGPPVLVVEVGAGAADDLQRLPVGQAEHRRDRGAPRREQRLAGARRVGADAARQAQQQVRVGADRLPQVALGERADAVRVAAAAEVRGEDLQVQVRRPAAVLGLVAEPADLLPAPQRGARIQALRARPREVAVERVEAHAVAGLVVEDDDPSPVARFRAERDGADGPVERRQDRLAGRQEDVDAEVQRAPLARQLSLECRGVVDPAVLEVASERGLDRRRRRVGAGEVDHRSAGERRPAHRAGVGEPQVGSDGVRRRDGLVSAGVAQAQQLELGRRGAEALQQRGDALLADQQVLVAGLLGPLQSGHRDAHRQPGADQVPAAARAPPGAAARARDSRRRAGAPRAPGRPARSSRRRTRPRARRPAARGRGRRSRSGRSPGRPRRRARCARSRRCGSPARAARAAAAAPAPRTARAPGRPPPPPRATPRHAACPSAAPGRARGARSPRAPRRAPPRRARGCAAPRRRGGAALPRLAGHPGEHPRAAAVVERRRAHEPRRGDREPGRGDVLHRRVLEVEHGRLEAGGMQLEHAVADPVVAVGLARQRRRLAREPEPLGRESGVVGREHGPIMADAARG